MAEKSMKNGSKIRWMGATYIKPISAYVKPISAYIKGWGTPISSLYQKMAETYIKPI